MIEEEYRQGKTFLKGLCRKCWSRYKLSKRPVKLKLVADDRLATQFVIVKPSPLEFVRVVVFGTMTMLENVNNHFKDKASFDTVTMVTVFATPNIQSMQNKISELLGLDLKNCNEEDAKDKLLDALRKKKFLLIVDDLWHELNLGDIGIPQPGKDNGCKILVSNQNLDVLKKLSESEAWSLFVAKAGRDATFPSIKPHAEIVLRKYEGLPLAIIIQKVFDSLMFSYDRLESDILVCALYNVDYSINQDELMSELVLWITYPKSKDNLKFLVRARASLKEAPEVVEWEEEDRISLTQKELEVLPELSQSCPKLVRLLLQGNETLKAIPSNSSFECMDRLHVLHLSDTRIKSLPSSLSCLVNLCVLNLISNNSRGIFSLLLKVEELNVAAAGGIKWRVGPREKTSPITLESARRVPTSISYKLAVRDSEELESLVVGEKAKEDNSFQSLTKLCLQSLPRLDVICSSVGCDRLKVVFMKDMAQSLTNIDEIRVCGCRGLEELIEEEEKTNNKETNGSSSSSPLFLTQPKLRKLSQKDLLQLSSLCSRKRVLDCPLINPLLDEAGRQARKMGGELTTQEEPSLHSERRRQNN
ncbi:hypothetical protein AMTRI_Chr05g63060 [Amborella trichopoda]